MPAPVDCVGLDRQRERTLVGHDAADLCSHLRFEKVRHCNERQDGDDGNDDQQFYQSKRATHFEPPDLGGLSIPVHEI